MKPGFINKLKLGLIQGGPGAPRGNPGLPGGPLAFPWVPLALPGCPWPPKKKMQPVGAKRSPTEPEGGILGAAGDTDAICTGQLLR